MTPCSSTDGGRRGAAQAGPTASSILTKAPAMVVSLREINADTVRQITSLSVSREQERFVASNAVSLAQALFSPEAWYRAIYVDEVPAGFVMLYDESLRTVPPPHPEAALWRFMVDSRFQRQGVGTAALEPGHCSRPKQRLVLVSTRFVCARSRLSGAVLSARRLQAHGKGRRGRNRPRTSVQLGSRVPHALA